MRPALDAARDQLHHCLDLFDRQVLSRGDLEHAAAALTTSPRPTQDLLYLQTRSAGVESAVVGSSMVVDGVGRRIEGPEPPYRTVLAAINDGWRVISFPDLGTVLDEHAPHGLGCGFVLERWSTA